MKIKLKNDDVRKLLDIETPEFPKYVAPIINLANQYAQGTRPKVVGQMTELIQHFTGRTLGEWERWYLKQKPEAIKNATEKILTTIESLKSSLAKIDRSLVEQWVRDLVIVKTFVGLRFQEAILKKGAEIKGTGYKLAEPADEAKGIDGYIGKTPVSIKPDTYKVKAALPEQIDTKIIYYGKVDGGIEVDYGEIL